jgi:predicted RNA-binding Zn ribbon-like protein
MSEMRGRVKTLKLLGGALCLDFANTVDWHASEHREELILDYGDLLAWATHTGALDGKQARRLRRCADARPAEAREALSRAIALREAIYRVFSTHARSSTSAKVDLEIVTAAFRESAQHLALRRSGEGYAWEWQGAEGELDWVRWMVARSAAELLASAQASRVRECAGPGCGWLFVDTSRNRSRRWCEMASCGNRAKARRNYARKRTRSSITGAGN